MKLKLAVLCLGIMLSSIAFAETKCFVVQENHKTLEQEGDCTTRRTPCSTFKIAISLMGYNEGLLIDELHPELPFLKGYADYLSDWKQAHNPTTWMKNSVLWYSLYLTQKFGEEKFKDYVTKLNYGNQDVSGDKGKNNGLTQSWRSSSLQISPQEQIEFLNKLLNNQLAVSRKAQEMTRNILFVEQLANGWQLYGKSGSGILVNAQGERNDDRQVGWYVGWLQKDKRKITFAYYIEDTEKQAEWAGLRAKAAAKVKLNNLVL